MGVIRGNNGDSAARRDEKRVDTGTTETHRESRADARSSETCLDILTRSVAGRGTVGVASGADSELILNIGDERFIPPDSIENTGK